MIRCALFLAGLLALFPACAEVRPFVPGSLERIAAARTGKPFIVAFWSASCTHCPAELKTLGELVRHHPGLDLVLIAADTPDEAPELARLAQGYGLGRQEQWVFADPQPERLRYEIDRRWYGELPRTYFFDRQHRREGRSGVIPAEQLQRWIGDHLK